MKTKALPYKILLLVCCLSMSGGSTALASATLTHRYSFTTNANDSVGTADGYMTNGASISGNALVLNNPGGSGGVPSSGVGQYVALPENIITGYTALTFETWVSYNPQNIPFGDFNRLWDFGNTDTNFNGTSSFFMDAGSDNYSYLTRIVWNTGAYTLWPTPPNDRLLDSPLWNHVVWTSDPQNGKVKIYLNGAVAGYDEGVTNVIADLIGTTTNNWLGRSNWGADNYLSGSFDEFRIYQGVLNQLQVEADYENGPDVYPASYGTVTNLTLQVLSSQMSLGGVQSATVLAAASGLTNKNIDAHDQCGVVYTSGNTSILTVNTNGFITAVGTGSTSITGRLASASAVVAISVVNTMPPELIHRYSFNIDGDASDSLGGSAFNGLLQGDATVTGGQLVLDGVPGTYGTYLYLPSGMVGPTNFTQNAVTFEAWASFGTAITNYSYVFSFGNIDNLGGGENYVCFCENHYGNTTGQSGFLVSSGDPGPNYEQDVFDTAGILDGQTNVHIVCVMNPNPNRTFLGYYLNGVLVASTTSLTKTLSQINDVYSYLGRSLYSGDAYLKGSIDEFRIYNGELNKFQVAANQQAGPDSTNMNIGTFVSFVFGTGGPMPKDDVRKVTAILNFTQATNVNVAGDAALTLSSSDTNVVTVINGGNNAGNMIAHVAGTATITGTYQYISLGTTNYYTNSASITVFRTTGAILTHRYGFTNDASDSIGGANGTLKGNATITGGRLLLNGTTNTYLNLPGGLVSSYQAATIECWAQFGASAAWGRLFDFGSTTNFGTNTTGPANYWFCTPYSGSAFRSDVATTAGFASIDGAPSLNGYTRHVVLTYDPSSGVLASYTNGVLCEINNAATMPLSSVSSDDAFIGRSQFGADPYLAAAIDEFRIYNGVLYSDEIAATQILGANQTLTTNATLTASVSGNNVVLSWPLAAAGFTVQSRTSLVSGTWTTVSISPQIVGNTKWQATVPVSGSIQFFRLSR
jgi:hypothetical protein